MKKYLKQLTHYILSVRNRHFFLADLLLLLMTPTLALMLRVDHPSTWASYFNALIGYTVLALIIRLLLFYYFGLYTRYWLYASATDLAQIVWAVVTSTALLVIIYFVFNVLLNSLDSFILPRSVPFIDGLLALVFIGASRSSLRFIDQLRRSPAKNRQNVLIVGAGEAGSMVVRELRKNPQVGLYPIGFVDDDAFKLNMQIYGIPVLGNRKQIPKLVHQNDIVQVIIAMPTAPGVIIRQVVKLCESVGVKTKIIPGMYELLNGQVSLQQLRDVEIEDLLRREPVHTDIGAVYDLLYGKRVLVTGGGGSIGSELCRQIIRCNPSHLILVGHGENSIFDIYHELLKWPNRVTAITPVIADVRFAQRIQAVFEQHKPNIVFHAAAHKHVPLMELNPVEAITNNVWGTRNVLEASVAANVGHFVMISTDKAVNPTSIMGACKRTAELLVHQAARRSGKSYVAVRFGNVLGSRGSVVLTFKKQIAKGGPITITDPAVERFFMTIPEAVELVLQAAVLGQGGEVFVLDMGQPIKIIDLAHDLIRLSGLEAGRDIQIEYVGLRPGEKLTEELFVTGENYERTKHQKIYLATNASTLIPEQLDELVSCLLNDAQRQDIASGLRRLKQLVPEFQPMSERLKSDVTVDVSSRTKSTPVTYPLSAHT